MWSLFVFVKYIYFTLIPNKQIYIRPEEADSSQQRKKCLEEIFLSEVYKPWILDKNKIFNLGML